ncbi:MAG TPA: hypothetical protein VG206_06760 [Terriglobia bacterium]|nr:hypothetical protein [Terriglobia bacterium]
MPSGIVTRPSGVIAAHFARDQSYRLALSKSMRGAAIAGIRSSRARGQDWDLRLWNRVQIAEALPLAAEALVDGAGPFALQAAIAAEHCRSHATKTQTGVRFVRLCDLLQRAQPSPVVSLNRAVAVAMVEGPRSGLALIDDLIAANELASYHLPCAVRADLLRRLGSADAATSYQRALPLVTNESERRFLDRRLREVQLREEPG